MDGMGDQIDRPRPRTSSRSRRVAGRPGPPTHTFKLSFVPRLMDGLRTVLRPRHDK